MSVIVNQGEFISTGNEWSEESSDAFWDMVNDQLLVAKVTLSVFASLRA